MNLSETVGTKGSFEALLNLEQSSKTLYERSEVLSLLAECGVDDPGGKLLDLASSNLLTQVGERYAFTSFGIRTTLLLEAINGGDIKDVYRRLTYIDSSLRNYELIREGMTRAFLENINDRPGFARLYLCSPWISLDRKQAGLLTHAVVQSAKGRSFQPEILVITRPKEQTAKEPPETVQPFLALGANVFLSRRLHTKLYIREPDVRGGYSMAILGSQNLTKSNYFELGVQINADSQIVDQLISYFLEITNDCYEI